MTGRPYGGGGKQLRMAPQESDKSESESESEEDEGPPAQHHTTHTVYGRGGGRGGKQLRMPGQDSDEESSGSDDDDDDEEEEEEAEQAAPPAPPPPPPQFRPSGGKSLMRMQRGVGKQLRMPQAEEEEDESGSDDSSDEEDEAPVQHHQVVQRGRIGGGKQLRPPSPKKEESDESDDDDDDDEEEDDEDAAGKEGPDPERRPEPGRQEEEEEDGAEAGERGGERMDADSEEDEEEEAAAPPPAPEPAPPPKAASDDEAEDMEESSEEEEEEEDKSDAEREMKDDDDDKSSSSGSSVESEEEQEMDMETFDTGELVKGEEDRSYLDSLPEFEREAILAERFDKLKNERDMKRALREHKRREREKRGKDKTPKDRTSKQSPAPKKEEEEEDAPERGGTEPPPAPAPEEGEDEEDEGESDGAAGDVPDTSGDAALAASLSDVRGTTRNRDATGSKGKKAAALAELRKERKGKMQKDESDSDLDYGDDDDQSSDEEYEGGAVSKPWLQKREKSGSAVLGGSDDEDRNFDDDGGGGGRMSADGKFVEAELEDFIKVTIPRRRLARWCNEPFFKDAVMGFYVRLAVGRDKMTQKPCYRLCLIVGVDTKPNEYKFPAVGDAKPVSTNKVLRLKFGNNTNTWRMHMVSDSRPTEDDVHKCINQMKTFRLSDILSKKQATKLRKKQDDLVNNYQYTKEDIEKSIEARKSKKVLNIGMEKTRISIAVQAARDAVHEAAGQLEEAHRALKEGGSDEVSKLERDVELAEDQLNEAKANLEAQLEDQKRILAADENRKRRIQQSKNVQHWNKVNKKAAMMNQSADFDSYKQQAEQRKREEAVSGGPKFNPYARRKVKPKILWEVGQKEDAKDGEDAPEEKKDDGAASKKATSANRRDDSDEGHDGGKENKRDEFLGSSQKASLVGQMHQFAIDDEVLARGSGAVGGIGSIGSKSRRAPPRVRKGISLAEYQERKAAGTL